MAEWDESNPADNDLLSQFPSNERDARDAVRSNFAVDHRDTDDSDVGKHEIVQLLAQTTPTAEPGQGHFYTKDTGSGEIELFHQDEDGNETQLTERGSAVPGVTASAAELNKADESETDNSAFLRSKFVGEVFALQDDVTGVNAPDNSTGVKFVQLTAGLTGAGQYNEGLLTSESTSGSSPTITATAVIDHSDSPMDGQTIRLINTEERFLRAGNAGTTQNSQIESHNHTQRASSSSGSKLGMSNSEVTGSIDTYLQTSSTGGNETRPRNVGITYYMRIA